MIPVKQNRTILARAAFYADSGSGTRRNAREKCVAFVAEPMSMSVRGKTLNTQSDMLSVLMAALKT
jgi:hypothetical protein